MGSIGSMADNERFRILIKAAGTIDKPQRQTVRLTDEPWTIEWSTSTSVSMSIDYFNMTIGRLAKDTDGKKMVEEQWRLTRVPGHERKIKYGAKMNDVTSTDAKPLSEGVYIVKISAMSSLTMDMDVEYGVGIAVIKMVPPGTVEIKAVKKTSTDPRGPVTITNETVIHLMDLLDGQDDTKEG